MWCLHWNGAQSCRHDQQRNREAAKRMSIKLATVPFGQAYFVCIISHDFSENVFSSRRNNHNKPKATHIHTRVRNGSRATEHRELGNWTRLKCVRRVALVSSPATGPIVRRPVMMLLMDIWNFGKSIRNGSSTRIMYMQIACIWFRYIH